MSLRAVGTKGTVKHLMWNEQIIEEISLIHITFSNIYTMRQWRSGKWHFLCVCVCVEGTTRTQPNDVMAIKATAAIKEVIEPRTLCHFSVTSHSNVPQRKAGNVKYNEIRDSS